MEFIRNSIDLFVSNEKIYQLMVNVVYKQHTIFTHTHTRIRLVSFVQVTALLFPFFIDKKALP